MRSGRKHNHLLTGQLALIMNKIDGDEKEDYSALLDEERWRSVET